MKTLIQKTDGASFFLNATQGSELASSLFSSKPQYTKKDIVILQVMTSHSNDWLVFELIFAEDFQNI